MIRVKGKVVECLGDEMMAVIWKKIKHKLILPYIDFGRNLKVFDLTLENRIIWGDDLVLDAAKVNKIFF
jgi:isocitrate dehydrogenase